MAHTLVLNATYEPLGVVSSRRAVVLVLADKAIAVEQSGAILHSRMCVVEVPSVIRLVRYVRVPHRAQVPLTRRAIFARDHGRCAYCGATATSVDHVVPRSRGGGHVWDNVVAACARCNRLKADRSVAELGWRMRSVPRQPTGSAWRILGTGRADPSWADYLVGHGLAEADAVSA
jgi:5-methylcytosine-specific restriction endonuclease McrA